MKATIRMIAAVTLFGAMGSACVPPPLFVRDSTYRESDIKFLVSDGSNQYVVRCDWTEVGGELQNCRKLTVKYAKTVNPGGAQ